MNVKTARHPGRRSTDAGFSLIEVVFALAFLGVGLLAVAQMIPLATHQIVTSKTTTDAVATGQAKMEELKMEDYSSTALTAGSYSDSAGQYTRAWTILDDTPVTGSKRVNLTVTWTTSSGTETARMTTFVTR